MEGGNNDAISWGFDSEQKLDLHYGFCLGLKQSRYPLEYQVGYITGFDNYPVREFITYWTVPVGVHYYFNPRLYAEGYTNVLFRKKIKTSHTTTEIFLEDIESRTPLINFDLGANICYLFTPRTQISMGLRVIRIFGSKKEVDVSGKGIGGITAIRL